MTTKGVTPLIAGNWKMNGLKADLTEVRAMAHGAAQGMICELALCLPATLLAQAAADIASSGELKLGGQDCHPNGEGAHTGDISAKMLADCGADYVIVGHSERRTDHGETSALVKAKAQAVQRAGIVPIVCIGETGDERKSGKTLAVLKAQMDGSLPDTGDFVLAYEPVWAIGTGLTPTVNDITSAHAFMRDQLTNRFGEKGAALRILYGGSVKPSNAQEILAVVNVDGALVGGASLKSADFLAIAAACK